MDSIRLDRFRTRTGAIIAPMNEHPHAEERVLLASASPRRRRLLSLLGIAYDVASVDIPEDPLPGETALQLAERLACEKALAASNLPEAGGRLIIAADTIVVDGDSVLGKPESLEEARTMLEALAGRSHVVLTSVAVLPSDGRDLRVETVSSRVEMRALPPEEIETWIDRGDLLGCAGAYNIEEHLGSVDLTECFQNVAGLPLCHLWRLLADGDSGPAPRGLRRPNACCDESRGVRCLLGPLLVGEERS